MPKLGCCGLCFPSEVTQHCTPSPPELKLSNRRKHFHWCLLYRITGSGDLHIAFLGDFQRTPVFALLSLRCMTPCPPNNRSPGAELLISNKRTNCGDLRQIKVISAKSLLASQWHSQERIWLLDSPTSSPAPAQVFRHSLFPYKLQPCNSFRLCSTTGKTKTK